MSLSHFPEPWRPNAIYKLSDRVTLRTPKCVFVLRCEKAGKGELRPPRVPQYAARTGEDQHSTEIVKKTTRSASGGSRGSRLRDPRLRILSARHAQ